MSSAGVQGLGLEIAGFQVWTRGEDSEAGSVSSFSSSEASVNLRQGLRNKKSFYFNSGTARPGFKPGGLHHELN